MPLRFHPVTRAVLMWLVYPAVVIVAGVYGDWIWAVVACIAVAPGYWLMIPRPAPDSN